MGSFIAVHGLSSCGVWAQQLQRGLSCSMAYGILVPRPGIEPTSSALLSGSSAGQESTCSAGDPSPIPGLGRSAREGIGYPLQYSWASLVAQLLKNLPAMWETWVWSLGWEDPLEKGRDPLQYSGLENSMDCSPWGHKESDTTEQLSLSLSFKHYSTTWSTVGWSQL